MDIYTPSIDVQKWFPDKSDLTKWVYDIIKYLHDTPIPTEQDVEKAVDAYLAENPITGNFYSADNPPPYPVTSVNGKTGAVTGLYSADNKPPYPVTSVNGKTGAVTGLYDASNPPPYPVTSVNGETGAVTGVYTIEFQPPYPVTSVNGKTGDVTGLYSADNKPPYPVKSVNGKTGAVTGLYDASNPPPYPVTSVNGKTGAVTVPGFSVGSAKLITPTNINTDNVTLTLSGYTQGKYKMIFVLFDCYSTNKDTGIALRANTTNVTLYSGVSDYDGGQYNYKVDGVICYPTALDDGGVLSLVASDGGAQIYTAQEANYWWGVE